MNARGVPVDRLDQKWGGQDIDLDVLLKHRLGDLGYTALCNIENLLDAIDETYTQAIGEAITEIAYFVGANKISVEDVIMMASEICPPPTNRKYEFRGINADQTIAAHRTCRESPFDFLRHPFRMAGTNYGWRFLRGLSLAQLELLAERLQNKAPMHCSTVLRFEPTQR
ncbi:MAG: hypothetical protein NTW28_19960 [Candidatus Solibacter sp.]|nr:hypothetical protein [Candidatus Solibacter sp.]